MSRRRQRSRWPIPAVGAVSVMTVVPMLVMAPPARADGPAYAAFAKATSFHLTMANQSFPVGLVIEGVGPEADATQSALGGGVANAAFPYLGDSLPGAPGIAGAALGLPTPPYPLVASATAGQDPARVAYPGVDLRAEAGLASTIGEATAGGTASGLTTTARVDQTADGGVTALAFSEGRALSLGEGLTLSGIRSEAKAVADPFTGELTRTSSASIGHIGIPGLGDLSVTNGQFSTTSFIDGKPQTFPVSYEAVMEAFAAAGVTMTFQAPQETSTGVISGVYTFAYTFPAPPPNTTYNGPTPVTFTTGNSTASVDLRPIRAENTGTGPSVGSAVGPSDGSPVSGPVGGALDGAGLPHLATPGAVVGAVPGLTTEPTAGLPRAQADSAVIGLFRPESNIFLAFIIAAALAFATATGIRLLGVRSLWG